MALQVSGGHTMLVEVRGVGSYRILGETQDDAAGEAFDKTAKLLGLGYPGGPELAALAERGRDGVFEFPRPMLDRPGLDFSFSGLKTAVVVAVRGRELDEAARADVARGFENAIVDTLVAKSLRALEQTGLDALVVAGGVGANRRLREALAKAVAAAGGRVYFPRPEFCTDNAAMIALAGHHRLAAGEREDLAVRARARWPLDELLRVRRGQSPSAETIVPMQALDDPSGDQWTESSSVRSPSTPSSASTTGSARSSSTSRSTSRSGWISRAAAKSDAIEDTLNYKSVAKRVLAFVEASSFRLVEALAGEIARIVLEEFKVARVRVTVHKPGAIRHSKDVGVIVERGLDD